MSALLSLDHVSRRFSGLLALDDVSVSLKQGEIVGLIGPNGAGKSTLLRILSGEEEASDGAVLLGERPLGEWSSEELAKARAKLSQESQLTFSFRRIEHVVIWRNQITTARRSSP